MKLSRTICRHLGLWGLSLSLILSPLGLVGCGSEAAPGKTAAATSEPGAKTDASAPKAAKEAAGSQTGGERAAGDRAALEQSGGAKAAAPAGASSEAGPLATGPNDSGEKAAGQSPDAAQQEPVGERSVAQPIHPDMRYLTESEDYMLYPKDVEFLDEHPFFDTVEYAGFRNYILKESVYKDDPEANLKTLRFRQMWLDIQPSLLRDAAKVSLNASLVRQKPFITYMLSYSPDWEESTPWFTHYMLTMNEQTKELMNLDTLSRAMDMSMTYVSKSLNDLFRARTAFVLRKNGKRPWPELYREPIDKGELDIHHDDIMVMPILHGVALLNYSLDYNEGDETLYQNEAIYYIRKAFRQTDLLEAPYDSLLALYADRADKGFGPGPAEDKIKGEVVADEQGRDYYLEALYPEVHVAVLQPKRMADGTIQDQTVRECVLKRGEALRLRFKRTENPQLKIVAENVLDLGDVGPMISVLYPLVPDPRYGDLNLEYIG